MTAAQLEAMVYQFVLQQLQGDRSDAEIVVARAPEGIVVLQRGGRHLLVHVSDATLEVVG